MRELYDPDTAKPYPYDAPPEPGTFIHHPNDCRAIREFRPPDGADLDWVVRWMKTYLMRMPEAYIAVSPRGPDSLLVVYVSNRGNLQLSTVVIPEMSRVNHIHPDMTA
jgi:hypothetical protein